VDMRNSLGAVEPLSSTADETQDDSRSLGFYILQGMEEKALDAAGFESTEDEDDLWKKDGVWFGRNAALQHRRKVDATNGKIIVSREPLGSLLENLEKRDDPTPLSPHERESLEELAVAVISEDEEIAISRELLEKWRSG
jgi:hypothetical protein